MNTNIIPPEPCLLYNKLKWIRRKKYGQHEHFLLSGTMGFPLYNLEMIYEYWQTEFMSSS